MLKQQQRNDALAKFRDRQARVLIATDVASRGLVSGASMRKMQQQQTLHYTFLFQDIPRVDVVVSHNVPERPKAYVHRVGRAARAGRFGTAVTFVTQYELERLRAVEKHTRVQMEELPVAHASLATDAPSIYVLRRESEIRVSRHWRVLEERKRIRKRLREQLEQQ